MGVKLEPISQGILGVRYKMIMLVIISTMPNIRLVEYHVKNHCLRFVITDCPTNQSVDIYIEAFRLHHVVTIVSLCVSAYDKSLFDEFGSVIELPITDGDIPNEKTIKEWIILINDLFFRGDNLRSSIAVHCLAGLGRAPLMVAIGLVVFTSKDYTDIVLEMRKTLGPVFYTKQIKFLSEFDRKKYRDTGAHMRKSQCIIS